MLPEVSTDELENVSSNAELFRLTAPVACTGQSAVAKDVQTLKKNALVGLDVADAFITATTPTGRKSDRNVLEFYPSKEAYLYALADALREEYKAITDAGFILQLDWAALNPQRPILLDKPDPSDEEIEKARDLGVELVNYSLRGIPEEKVRYHHCWGSNAHMSLIRR
jgi:5-methyltetrahydropteroyltriglutamate--homocysteine methyltransferase